MNNGSQGQGVQVQLTAPQMTSVVLLNTRIVDLNNAGAVCKQMGQPQLAAAIEEATKLLSKAHDDFITEAQRAVKLAAPGELPLKLVTH